MPRPLNAQSFRDQAADCRKRAAAARLRDAREQWTRIAEAYEQLADRVDDASGSISPK